MLVAIVFAVAVAALLTSGVFLLFALALCKRAAEHVTDADARRDRALALLNEEQQGRADERRFYFARFEMLSHTYRDTIAAHRDALDELARLYGLADDGTDAPAKSRKRIM